MTYCLYQNVAKSATGSLVIVNNNWTGNTCAGIHVPVSQTLIANGFFLQNSATSMTATMTISGINLVGNTIDPATVANPINESYPAAAPGLVYGRVFHGFNNIYGSTGVGGALPVAGDLAFFDPNSSVNGSYNLLDSGIAVSTCGSSACISTPLSAITPAVATNTINNQSNSQGWNWALTGSSQAAMTFGESSPAVGSGDIEFQVTTQPNSTAIPVSISQGQGKMSNSAPLALSVSGGLGGSAGSNSAAGNAGGGVTVMTGTGSSGGSSSGNGGSGGALTLSTGNGGSANGTSTAGSGGTLSLAAGTGGSAGTTNTNGGSGGWIYVTAGNGATGGATGSGGAGGNIILTPGLPGGTGAASGAPGNVQIMAGTVGAALTTPFLNISGTWNTTGLVDAGIYENITNMTSNSGSLLEDLRVSPNSKWKVDVSGNVTAAGSVTAGGGLAGVGGTFKLPEGTAATSASATDVCYGDSSNHAVFCSLNGGSFVEQIGPKPQFSQINDTSHNNEVLAIGSVPSAVDYVTVTPSATGGASPGTVMVGAAGSDSNVNLALTAQGTGVVVKAKRYSVGLGTPLTVGTGTQFAFSGSGWGSSPSFTGVTGTDAAFSLQVTSGTGTTAGAAITLTFADLQWPNAPIYVCTQNGGSGNGIFFQASTTTTVLTITAKAAPTISSTYVINCIGMGI